MRPPSDWRAGPGTSRDHGGVKQPLEVGKQDGVAAGATRTIRHLLITSGAKPATTRPNADLASRTGEALSTGYAARTERQSLGLSLRHHRGA